MAHKYKCLKESIEEVKEKSLSCGDTKMNLDEGSLLEKLVTLRELHEGPPYIQVLNSANITFLDPSCSPILSSPILSAP